ncbi:MAG TPA: TonB family protein, partial [Polyangiaceae bacterium]|nr:TonB family protein [Polyangiaceae bacterium]
MSFSKQGTQPEPASGPLPSSSPRTLSSPPLLGPVDDEMPALVANKYQPFARLGRGGMADVFLALARGPAGFNKLVVLKTLRLQRDANDAAGAQQMLFDEARLAARLNHANVVHTYEMGDHEGRFYIAMEYVDGQPLTAIARRLAEAGRAFPPEYWVRILADTLRGLQYAHEMRDYDGTPLNIVHRDISPHNVLVTYEGVTKIVDFGIAKTTINQHETAVGVLKGKFAYMAPEQVAGSELLDGRADLFAVGVTLWEVLTGERLFYGAPQEVLQKLLNAPIPAAHERAPEIDRELSDIVARALSRHPADRFPDARSMAQALEDYLARAGKPAPREDIGHHLAGLFEAERAELRSRVQGTRRSLPSPAPSLSASGSHVVTGTGTVRALSSDQGRASAAPPLRADRASEVPAAARVPLWRQYGGWLAAGAGLVAVGVTAARWGDASRQRQVAPPAAEARALSGPAAAAEPESFHLMLTSEPAGAQVDWAGRPVGQTPLLIDLLPGPQALVVSLEGFLPTTVVVNVSDAMAGRTQSRTVLLAPKAAVSPQSLPPAAVPAPAPAAPARDGGRGHAAHAPARGKERASGNEAGAAAEIGPGDDIPRGPARAAPAAAAAAAATPAPEAVSAAAAPKAAEPGPAAPKAGTVLPFGPEMTRPTLLAGAAPAYPREALVAGVEGTMVVRCTINTAGSLQNCRILKGLPFMEKPVLEAMATRKYTPVMLRGAPVAVEYVFTLR